jgi:hypothetical protein
MKSIRKAGKQEEHRKNAKSLEFGDGMVIIGRDHQLRS